MKIVNAHVMDPASGIDGLYDIRIRGGRIEEMTPAGMRRASGSRESRGREADNYVIDARGMIAAPGLVDVHVHFRDPGYPDKEDIFTGARAAARGGFTTVIMMANTDPRIDSPLVLSYVKKRGDMTGIRVESCANVTVGMMGRSLVDMDLLKKAGAAGFTDDGVPILDPHLAEAAMRKTTELQVPVSFHEEDPAYIENNGINRGAVSEKLGIGGSSREAEVTMVRRDLVLALLTGASVDIQHISAKEAVAAVRSAKAALAAARAASGSGAEGDKKAVPVSKDGAKTDAVRPLIKLADVDGGEILAAALLELPEDILAKYGVAFDGAASLIPVDLRCEIHAEATPHHFSLTEDAVLIHGTCAKMNPPLRTEADRQAIIAGLADGTIDLIATDHAPHTKEEKARPLTQAPSGIIGLETALSLGIASLVRPGFISLMDLLRLMTVNPADMYHLEAGRIVEGGPADLVLFNPEGSWIAGQYASKAENSPFTGQELPGVVEMTICGGEIAYQRERA